MIHGDFKPDNLVVEEDGRVVLLDFGLAARLEGESISRSPSGTPAYAAPEQWNGASVDSRADQYAFCATAWETLFGSIPAREERSDDGAGSPWAQILLRGMSANHSSRYPDLRRLLDDLRFPGSKRPSTVPPIMRCLRSARSLS